MYNSHFVYPFICWWTFKLSPPFGYCEYCCYKNWYTNICSNLCFQYFWIYIISLIAGSHGNSMFKFLRHPNYCFPEEPYHFTLQPATTRILISPYPCQHFLQQQYFIVVLICIFLMIMLNIFSYADWSFVHILWRNVHQVFCLFFKIRLLVELQDF